MRRKQAKLDLFQYFYQFRIILKMAIGLKIITGLVFRSKKDEFHSRFFGADKVFARIVTNVDRLLGLYGKFFHRHFKKPYIWFLESNPG